MNYKRLLNTKVGIVFISIMLGLGLAVLFRTTCTGKNCLNFKGPKFSDIQGKTYQFGDSCYKYDATSGNCNSNKQILPFSNGGSKSAMFEGMNPSITPTVSPTVSPTITPTFNVPSLTPTSAPSIVTQITQSLSNTWGILTELFKYTLK